MDMRFKLDQIFEKESIKEDVGITQDKTKVQGEEAEHSMLKEKCQENEPILDLKETEIESKSSLEVVLPIVSQIHFYALHCPISGVEGNTTKQVLFPFPMSKLEMRLCIGFFFFFFFFLFFF